MAKDAIEPVPPANMRSGFVSPYLILPKKSIGLRLILYLRVLIHALHKLPFKMLMQKRIFECIHPLDWFAAMDLKDARFHVSILPCQGIPAIRVRGLDMSVQAPAFRGKEKTCASADDRFSLHGARFGQPDSTSHPGTCSVSAELP